MLDIKIIPKRHKNFWDGVNQARTEEYRKELTEAKEDLERLTWTQQKLLETNDKRIEELKGLINDELKLCDFYSKYAERQQEENFDKWVLVKTTEEWSSWVRYNGKIRALISLDSGNGKQMVKVALRIENDSEQIDFLYNSYGGSRQEITYSHLKNQKSIEERVKEYKQKAEELMKKHQYPYYCMELGSFRILEQLLHIEEAK